MPNFFQRVILTGKVGKTDLIFDVQSSLVGLCMRHYKSVCSCYDLCNPV